MSMQQYIDAVVQIPGEKAGNAKADMRWDLAHGLITFEAPKGK
jgi:hypothetical protein